MIRRMKILLLTRMMEVHLQMILEKNLMLVIVEVKKRSLLKRNPRKSLLLLSRHRQIGREPKMAMKIVQRRRNLRRKKIQTHQRNHRVLLCSSRRLKGSKVFDHGVLFGH